jgi:CBS domain-containing protein
MSVVSEIMSPKETVALRIEQIPSALDAAKIMIKNRVGSILVVDHDRKPIGVVTERDVLRRVTALNKLPKDIAVQEIMSSPVITIKAYDSVNTAAAVMAKNNIKRLVVLEENGSVAGVLSITDITRKLARILASDYDRYGHWKAISELDL